MTSHVEFLRRVTLDESLATAVRTDYQTADITPREKAMLDYAVKLTRRPWTMTQDDVQALRVHGFDDKAILQINLTTAWFNYINRVADGLGIGK